MEVSSLEYNAKIKENEDLRQRIDALKQQVQRWKHKCTALETWKREHQQQPTKTTTTATQVSRRQKNNARDHDTTMVSMEQVQQFLAEYGGLSRYTIVDDAWHNQHPKAANHLLGFPTWDEGKQIMKLHFPDVIQATPKLYLSRNSQRLQIETGTTLFERCVAVKLMERLGLAASKCGSIYSADERTVKSWRAEWQKKWGMDEIKVFQCPPLLGPSAIKKRKRMNEMAAVAAAAPASTNGGAEIERGDPFYLNRVDPSSHSQQPPGTFVNNNGPAGHDEFLMDREALHLNATNSNREQRQEEAARAFMVPDHMQQPPLAAAVAAFIRQNSHNNNFHPHYRGPYETGGYY